MPKSERRPVEFAIEELAQINRLLDKARAESERRSLSQAHEALLAARQTYEYLAAQIAEWPSDDTGDQQIIRQQLAQADEDLTSSERRMAAQVNNPRGEYPQMPLKKENLTDADKPSTE